MAQRVTMKAIKPIFRIVFLLWIACWQCIARSDEFRVVSPDLSLPPNPQNSSLTHMTFVLAQLHTSLFDFNQQGFSSSLLKSWKASKDFRDYELCPDNRVRFANGRGLTAEILLENFRRLARESLFGVGISSLAVSPGNCLKVGFEKPYTTITEDLSHYRTAIIDPKTENDEIPIGISVYMVEKFSRKSEMVLRAQKWFPRPYFDSIRIESYRDGLNLESFHEVNLIQQSLLPSKVRNAFKRVYSLNSVANYLFVNHEKQNLRRQVLGCLDRTSMTAILKQLVPLDIDVRELASIVPASVFLAPVVKERSCVHGSTMTRHEEVKFHSTFSADVVNKGLEKYLKDTLAPLGIEVKYQPVKPDVFLSELKHLPDKSMIIAGVSSRSVMRFLNVLGLGPDTDRIAGMDIKAKQEIKASIANSRSSKDFERAVKLALKAIDDTDSIFPVLEIQKFEYYPKALRLVNDRNLSGSYLVKDLEM